MKNYLFDIYGTLIDIRTDECKADFWENVSAYCRGLGGADIPYQERFFALCRYFQGSIPNREINILVVFDCLMREAGLVMKHEALRELAMTFRTLSLKKLQVYPQIPKTLKKLKDKGARLFVFSNGQEAFSVPELKRLGLYDWFEGVELSSDFGFRKPETSFFDHVLWKYNLERDETVCIGNEAEADVNGAFGARLQSVYIHTETSPSYGRLLTDNVVLDGDFKKLEKMLVKMYG